MADVLQTLLGVPQAVGGGALDILIGDRTNVPAGEQVKRSIEALLLAGDNPSNLIAIHGMNAKRDAQNQAAVSSPDFQRAMETNRVTKNLSPMEAYEYTAKQFGVKGYAPATTESAVDLAPGGPSAPERQTVPVLPPPPVGAETKYLEDATKLRAYTTGDPLDQVAARAEGAGVSLPIDLQQLRADRAMEGRDIPGQTLRTETWNGKEYVVKIQDLPPQSRVLSNFGDAIEAANAQNVVLGKFGVTDRVVPIGSNVTGWSLTKTTDKELEAMQTARGSVIGKAEGGETQLPSGRTANQIELANKRAEAAIPTGPERAKSASNLDLVTRLENLKLTYAKAQDAKLGGALGKYVDALTGGQPTGPLASWVTVPLARYTSLGTDAQRQLIREQSAIENQFIQAITGAQVSWQEAVRLAKQLPRLEDGGEFFLQGIDTSIENLRGLEAAKATARGGVPGLTADEAKSALEQARGGLTATDEKPTSQATPGASTLKLKSGKTVTVEY